MYTGEVTTTHPYVSSPKLLNEFQFNMVVMSGEFIFGYVGPIQSLLYMTFISNFIFSKVAFCIEDR
jgi:hypothetical protein